MRRHLEIEHLLKLSLVVYRVIELFPTGEPLKNQIRESANRILADFLLGKTDENGSRSIEEILGFFDEAEKKNWVDPRNFFVLKREYDKIRQSLGPGPSAGEAGKNSGKTVENSLSAEPNNNHRQTLPTGRQGKILKLINGNGKVKIGELVGFFPGVNRRTVLRDLEKLCQTGVAVRNGSGRGAYYIKNGQKHDTPLIASG